MRAKQATTIDAAIAQRVLVQRRRLGLSQSELAAQLGVTFQQIQKYERGTNRIGAGRLFQMATIFNIPVQALFPDPSAMSDQTLTTPIDADAITELLLTTEGRRMSLAFAKLRDGKVRKKVVALIEALIGQYSSENPAES